MNCSCQQDTAGNHAGGCPLNPFVILRGNLSNSTGTTQATNYVLMYVPFTMLQGGKLVPLRLDFGENPPSNIAEWNRNARLQFA